MNSRLLASFAIVIAAFSSGARADFNFGNLGQYDLVVANNFTNATSDVEGRALVGGSISGNTNSFGQNLNSAFNGTNTLIVGGTLNTSPHVTYGNVYVSSSSALVGSPQFTSTSSQQVVTGLNTTNLTTNIQAALDSAKNNLNVLITDTTATTITNPAQASHVTIDASKVNASGYTIINIAGSLLNNSNIQELDLANSSSNSKIIINVTGGGTINENIHLGGQFSSTSTMNSNIIWNFGNATSVTLSTSLDGAILAADAAVSNPSTQYGPLYASSFSQGGEIHLPYESTTMSPNALMYSGPGFSAVAVPEPATVVSTLSGLVILGGAAWRRHRRCLA